MKNDEYQNIKLSQSFEKWKKMRIPQISKKDEFSILKICFFNNILKKILLNRKKNVISNLKLNYERISLENVIKNIFPLTNVSTLTLLKINQNKSFALNKIILFSKSDQIQQKKIHKFVIISQNLVNSQQRDVFLNLVLFNYNGLKPLLHFKENLKKEFSKLNRKFHQISKKKLISTSPHIKTKKPANNFTKKHHYFILALEKMHKFFTNKNVIQKSFAWSRFTLIFWLSKQKILNLSKSNRCNGVIKHLNRNDENNSFVTLRNSTGSAISVINKENIQNTSFKTQMYNEDFLEAIKFLNNL